MSNLHNLLIRKQKIEDDIESLMKRIANLRFERDRIEVALSVLNDFHILDGIDIPSKPRTIGAMALKVLEEYPDGLPALEILRQIQQRWMPDLVRTSLSPPLSRLKERGILEVVDEKWRFKQPTLDSVFN